MRTTEKRKYKRLGLKLQLYCVEVAATPEKIHTGETENISPGGLYFQTSTPHFQRGNLLKVELSIPPDIGSLEFGGGMSGYARVIRSHKLPDDTSLPNESTAYGVALEFCQPPKFSQ
jgi:hypothetical protein